MRNVEDKNKTVNKSYCKSNKLTSNGGQSGPNTLKDAQSYTREKSLPAKIEDELEKAKRIAQQEQPYAAL